MIYVHYRACDGFETTKKCETLDGARNWAWYWLGQHPEKGRHYAVSQDGIGTISLTGASLDEVWPEDKEFVFVVNTLDSHEHYGPFASYKIAYYWAHDYLRWAGGQSPFVIDIQEI